MARPPSGNPKSSQINVRLTAAESDDLDALAYLRRESASALVRRLVEAELERWRSDPRFQAAVTARVDFDAEMEGDADVVNINRPGRRS